MNWRVMGLLMKVAVEIPEMLWWGLFMLSLTSRLQLFLGILAVAHAMVHINEGE